MNPLREIEEDLCRCDASFSQTLFHLIDTKGMTDVEVYTRARIDRKLFSKIRKSGYHPKKKTIIALVLALELNYTETINLLNLAGYTLSPALSLPADVIISNCIRKRIYDIEYINEIMHHYDLPLIGE